MAIYKKYVPLLCHNFVMYVTVHITDYGKLCFKKKAFLRHHVGTKNNKFWHLTLQYGKHFAKNL